MIVGMAGLYIHIPFCEHKCLYCDFYSIVPAVSQSESEELKNRYLASLKDEIKLAVTDLEPGAEFDTVFFGGGTPSLLHPSEINLMLNVLTSTFTISNSAEITLEVNPGTVDRQKLKEFRSEGINRLSVGVQSFHEEELRFLTRIHTVDEAIDCVEKAFSVGFKDISMDLIFSIPGQTIERWKQNLEQAIQLNPTHLSCYSLTVEPGTPLARMVQARQIHPLPDDVDAELYALTIELLRSKGYEQYEVSNFARPGYKCRHNVNYWNHTNYLGFGPSAHSYWNGKRWWNSSDLGAYLHALEEQRLPIEGSEVLTPQQMMEEEMFLGLRAEGLNVAGFKKKHGRDLANECRTTLETLERNALIRLDGENLRLTPKGYSVCDEICASLMR